MSKCAKGILLFCFGYLIVVHIWAFAIVSKTQEKE